jgi:hypothetical protein
MKQPWEWDEDDIIRLVGDRISESINLEFKSCDALTDQRWKQELAKDVSAFANSAGATIIYGVVEDRRTHEAKSIDAGFDPREIDIESLEQIINSRIQRKIEGIRYKVISLHKTSPGRVIFLLHVPESNRAPHMSDYRFYKRYNFQSVYMEEFEVRDRYRRETYPSHEIVRAWFDDAINPTIDLLQREAGVLTEETWTWDHRKEMFRGLTHIADSSSFAANEEDFLSRHSHIEEAYTEHDDSLITLNTEADKLFEALAESSFLRDAYSGACSAEALNALKPDLTFKIPSTPEEVLNEIFGVHSTEAETLAWLAECSMNTIDSLPHDRRNPFWKGNRDSFLQLLQQPPLSQYRLSVVEAREDLAFRIQGLIGLLKRTRRELSERHGVPVESKRSMPENELGSLGLGIKRYY